MIDEIRLNSAVKITTFDHEENELSLFSGMFYDPQIVYNYNYGFNCFRFIVTAKHCIIDESISLIEISYINRNGNKVSTIKLELKDYNILEVPECDLAILYFNGSTVNHCIQKNNIVNGAITSHVPNSPVSIPGYYTQDIDVPILETATTVSSYNENKFYIKSRYISNGYSGAPVFINYLKLEYNNKYILTGLIGFISEKFENDNILVTSAENLNTIHELLQKKLNSL